MLSGISPSGGCGAADGAVMETFADLPDALVRDLLDSAIPVAKGVEKRLSVLRKQKDRIRDKAEQCGIIGKKADLEVAREPSIAGVDGSYQIHRLTSLDLCAAAAVAVQGTTIEESNKHWPAPHHQFWVEGISHYGEDTTGLLRAVMVAMELELAAEAPHDLVLLDGSFASLVIYVNQGLGALAGASSNALSKKFREIWEDGLFRKILESVGDKRTVAVPKYTARKEFLEYLGMAGKVQSDDKTVATMILRAGEYTQPLLTKQAQGAKPYHLARCSAEENRELGETVGNVHIVYFRPYQWLPALRLEISARSASSKTFLAQLLEGVQRQLFSPVIIEPYPLFLADRMVKSLGAGIAVVEQSVAQHVISQFPGTETTIQCLQNYRTESGRGGV